MNVVDSFFLSIAISEISRLLWKHLNMLAFVVGGIEGRGWENIYCWTQWKSWVEYFGDWCFTFNLYVVQGKSVKHVGVLFSVSPKKKIFFYCHPLFILWSLFICFLLIELDILWHPCRNRSCCSWSRKYGKGTSLGQWTPYWKVLEYHFPKGWMWKNLWLSWSLLFR